ALSMYPTYRDGKISVVNHLAFAWRKPQRGDVIAFRDVREDAVLLKRIIGLPGERVAVRKGKVFINGELLEDEPYVKEKGTPNQKEIALEEDEYFVMGD